MRKAKNQAAPVEKAPSQTAKIKTSTAKKASKPQTRKHPLADGRQLQQYGTSNGANLPADIQDRLADAVEKQNVGRASTFTEEKALILLERISEGSTVQDACKKAGVSRSIFYTWKAVVPGFSDMVTRAHEYQAASMVDDSIKALQDVDVKSKGADPRLVMAQLRKAEQVARFKLDLAKCLDFRTFGDKKAQFNVNANLDIQDADVSRWFNK